MNRRRLLLSTLALATALPGTALPGIAWAQTYPAKPIRLIVPFPAGGPADLFGRALATGLSAQLGQQVVIENRAGAGGLTGVDAAAKSAPDGYTLVVAGAAALSTIPFMTDKMPFNWEKDLALITLVSRVPEVMTVTPKLGVDTVQELVAYAKKNPGKVNFASAGVGSITHLAGELFKREAGVDIVHVPYRGAAPAVNDMLGGHVQMLVADVPVLLAHVRSGALKAIALTSEARAKVLPDVPTTAEVGYPRVLSDNWYGLAAPGGTPPDVLKRLHAAAQAALRSPELIKQFDNQAAIAAPTTPQAFAEFVRSERDKWGPIVRAAGARLE